jgi:membrane-bound lytic murein transglycosylase D
MRTGLLVTSLLFANLFLFLTSCASFRSSNNNGVSSEKADVSGSESYDVHNEAAAKLKSYQLGEKEPEGAPVPEFDQIPEVVKPSVQKWVQYFTGRGRDHMERYLSRSTRYEHIMKKVLRENGLPTDLLYIALIESGFSPKAISRAAAVGYWQFIRGTGKKYGLEITSFIDERRDPVLATQAAADYFKELYSNFNSWYLSMASYNVGEGRVWREVRKTNSKDFWYLAKKHRFPKETINYVPKFLAARMIGKDPVKYGFTEVPFEPPIEFETVALGEAVNLRIMADKMSVDYAELKRLNPKYRGEVAPLDRSKKLELRIPPGTSAAAIIAAKDSIVKEIVFIADHGEADVYKVRRGDTLNKIAKRFQTNVAALKDLNNFSRKMRFRPGRTIFVPLVVTRDDLADMNSNSKTAPGVYHTVAEGETLPDVANKNKVTVEDIKELNKLNDGDIIHPGSRLLVQPLAVIKKTDVTVATSTAPVAAPVAVPVPVSTSPVASDVKQKTVEAQIAAQIAPNAEASSVAAATLAGINPENAPATTIHTVENEPAIETVPATALPVVTAVPANVDSNPVTHTVKAGENLTTIAKKYGITIHDIRKANKIGRRSMLRTGRELIIPVKSQEKSSGTLNSRSQTLKLLTSGIISKTDAAKKNENIQKNE